MDSAYHLRQQKRSNELKPDLEKLACANLPPSPNSLKMDFHLKTYFPVLKILFSFIMCAQIYYTPNRCFDMFSGIVWS
jgi:hypothetical protein